MEIFIRLVYELGDKEKVKKIMSLVDSLVLSTREGE